MGARLRRHGGCTLTAAPGRQQRVSRIRWLVTVAVVALLTGVGLQATSALDALERRSIDQRFALRGPRAPHPGIVLVGLDQRSIEAINHRPPIPRKLYAELLDRLKSAGARLVALDVQFIGTTTVDQDNALASAITRHRPVVLATHDGPDGPLPVPAGRDVAGAVPASVGVDVDPDAVLRRQLYAPVAMPSFPVRVAELVTQRAVAEARFPGNHAWIDFAGPPGSYPHYSLADVLDGRVDASELRGKVVLVGVTDPAQRDVFLTSASSIPMSGVEVHANALASILNGLPLGEVRWTVTFLLLVALIAIPCLVAGRMAPLMLIGLGLGVAVLYLGAAQLAFNYGRILPIAAPILALGLATAGAATVDSLSERRRRVALEATLADLPTELDPAFFISYRRDQSSWPAQALRDGLEERFGRDTVFMDLDSLHPGQEWGDRISAAIASSSAVLVLIGPDWLDARDDRGQRRLDQQGDWVRREVAEALSHPSVTVVPILVDGASMPSAEALPPSLADLPLRNAYRLSALRWSTQLDEMVQSLLTGRLGEALRRPHPPPSTNASGYDRRRS